MIVFHDSFGELSKPQNHASHDLKILYYLRLAQPRNQINNAIQGGNCVLETAVGNSLCHDTMIQNIILPQISSGQKSNS